MSGRLVYNQGMPTSSLLLKVPTESTEVLTPPDTAEIRQVTEAMREDVLHVDKFTTDDLHRRLARGEGRKDGAAARGHDGGRHSESAGHRGSDGRLGQRLGPGSFTANQTDFGIKPYSGGPAGTVKVANRVTLCFDLVAVRGLDEPAGRRPVPAAEAVTVPGCVDKAKVQADTGRRTM